MDDEPMYDPSEAACAELDGPDITNHIWVTRDGTRVPVSRMTDQHIKNCLRTLHPTEDWYEVFNQELAARSALASVPYKPIDLERQTHRLMRTWSADRDLCLAAAAAQLTVAKLCRAGILKRA